MLDYLQTHFDIESSAADYYVGFEITRCQVSRVLFISQERYILKILECFGMSNCQIVSTPSDPHVHLELNLDGPHADFPYKEDVGCLLYALVICCPDIAYAISCVAKYVDNPSNIHVTAVKRIFRYLHSTADFRIVYTGYPCDLQLVGWCDADYATDHDDRRSCTCYIFTIAHGVVAWCSQRQPCTSMSTTEAEYISMCAATKEAIWLC